MIFRNLTILLAGMMLIKYFIFLLLAAFFPVRTEWRRFRELKREIKRYGKVRDYKLGVSVIIPAWNEEVGIIRTMQSVLNNDYPHIEMIVVNDGSTDNSRTLVDAFIAEYEQSKPSSNRMLRQLYIPNGGKGKALNHGIKHSHGRIILTVDADSALAPDAVSNLVEHFRDPTVDAVVGQVRVINIRGRLISRIQQLEYLFGFYFKRAHCVLGAEYIYGGACAAFRRKTTFQKFGLFDEKNKTEDIEMSMRTKYHGMKSVYAEDVLCFTEGANSYTGLINQRLRWKKGRFDTFIQYRQMFFSWKRHHNKPMSWFILPYALFSELQLILEPIGATLLIVYSLLSSEYVSLALSMLFIGVSYVVVAAFGVKLPFRERLMLVVLWPFTWLLFYIIVWIEFHALLRAMHMVLRGDSLEWQQWKREGI
jgi:cellulose synthase/poly-beta-1,6-N-acetylglucosamine synthase-like glycosyltransferase